MEKDRYFSFLPMPEAETNLQCIQKALKKQQQMREKETQLYNQLEIACQRQCEAHRRNQDVMTDFRRIEQELARLAARTDNFRINQMNYMKPLQTLLPTQNKCLASSICSKKTHHTNIDDLSANCRYFEHCRFTDSPDHFSQTARNHRLQPNHLIGLQGCCNHSTCCSCIYNQSDGNFVPYKCTSSDSMHSTNKLLFHRDDSSNKKDGRIQQCPQFTNEMNNTSRGRIIPPEQYPLQQIWNKNMHGDSSEKFLIGAQEMVVGDEVKAAVDRPLQDRIQEISALPQDVPSNSIAEEYKCSSETTCKLQHLPTTFICLKRYDVDDNTQERSRRGQFSEQNLLFESATEKHNANSCTQSTQTWFSLESKNVDDCDEVFAAEIIQENKAKKGCKSNKNGQTAAISHKSCEEKRLKHTSKTEHIGDEVTSQSIIRNLSNNQIFFLDGLFEESSNSEENSDSRDNCSNGEAKKHKIIEAEMLSRQKSLQNYQSQNERSVHSDLSEDKSSIGSNKSWSISDRCLEMKEHKSVEDEYESIIRSKCNFITEDDEKIDGEIGEENESHKEDDNEVMEMVQGKLRPTEIRISKSKEAENWTMYREETKINNNSDKEDDEESIGEMACIDPVKEGEIKDTMDSRVRESDIEDTDDDDDDGDDHDNEEDRICGEDEKTDDRIQQRDRHEANCNVEVHKNEAISEGREESKPDVSGEESFCEDQDEIEDVDLSEGEENDDLWPCNEDIEEVEIDTINKNISLKNLSKAADHNRQTPTSKEEPAYLREQVDKVRKDVVRMHPWIYFN